MRQGILIKATCGMEKGEKVYEWTGPTYGCLLPNEVAITVTPYEGPFMGIPKDAVQ